MDLSTLIQKGVLTDYQQCPVCGSEIRKPIEVEYVHTKYLAALDSILPIGVKYPIKQCNVYECSNCGTKYADPWLTRKYASMLYSIGLGQHKSGWLALYKRFKKNNKLANHEKKSNSNLSAIYLHALEYIDDCKSYLQINCPLSGDLLTFREMENPNISYKKEFNKLRRTINKNNVFPRNLFKRIRKKLKIYSRVIEHEEITQRINMVPEERILLYEPSSLCWGANCNLSGVSCHALSSSILKAPIQSLSDIEERGDKIDVCRFINLDHFFKPMEILDRILDVTKICIVHTHVDILKMQHHFVFSKSFHAYLSRCGYNVKDMTQLLDKNEQVNYSQFLISKCIKFD